MTNQEIFDRVASHLLVQGRAAVDVNSCRYRANDGTQCAFGCLIPDELYDERMEGTLASQLLNSSEWQLQDKLGITLDGVDLIQELQYAHDQDLQFEGLITWINRMESIAVTWSLSPAILDTQSPNPLFRGDPNTVRDALDTESSSAT